MDEAWILCLIGLVVLLLFKLREISGRFPGIFGRKKDDEFWDG